MSRDAHDALVGIARRADVRTRPGNLSLRGFGVRDRFDRRCAFNSAEFRVEVWASPIFLWILVNCESAVVFATPRADPILNVRSLLGKVAGHDVYVNKQGLGSPTPWIYGAEATSAIESLELTDDELLTITRGGPVALLRSAGAQADWERLQRLIALGRKLPAIAAGEALDRRQLPEDLRELFPLLNEWGKADDLQRSDLIEDAESAALEELVKRGQPMLTRISEYLGQPDVQQSDMTSALDAFAQAVLEAEQELQNRSERHARGRPTGS